ncbi:MAG: hypothetical protein Q7S53_01730 [bacterium]|nr:hypothetical protein [bacterium]
MLALLSPVVNIFVDLYLNITYTFPNEGALKDKTINLLKGGFSDGTTWGNKSV